MRPATGGISSIPRTSMSALSWPPGLSSRPSDLLGLAANLSRAAFMIRCQPPSRVATTSSAITTVQAIRESLTMEISAGARRPELYV